MAATLIATGSTDDNGQQFISVRDAVRLARAADYVRPDLDSLPKSPQHVRPNLDALEVLCQRLAKLGASPK